MLLLLRLPVCLCLEVLTSTTLRAPLYCEVRNSTYTHIFILAQRTTLEHGRETPRGRTHTQHIHRLRQRRSLAASRSIIILSLAARVPRATLIEQLHTSPDVADGRPLGIPEHEGLCAPRCSTRRSWRPHSRPPHGAVCRYYPLRVPARGVVRLRGTTCAARVRLIFFQSPAPRAGGVRRCSTASRARGRGGLRRRWRCAGRRKRGLARRRPLAG